MLDQETRHKIDNARDILVGKVPNPQSQVEQITIALIYKFMDDMDKESVGWGGKPTFFSGEYEKYAWSRIFDPKTGGHELIILYQEAIEKLNHNPNIPQLFRDIFKNAYLPYRDPETLKMFLKEINEFSYDHSERLGDAFEYLLSVLSSQGAAGQFRTPRHIIDFIVAVVSPRKEQTVLDPACGTAGFLISAFKHIMQTNGKDRPGDQLDSDEQRRLLTNFTGYDISPDMIRLALVNMYLHGFPNPQIHEYDTLSSENRWDETFDVILANPPFMTPKGGIRPHKRFSIQANRSEVLFVDYIAEHLNPGGRAGVIVPEGIIFQSSNAYKALRKMLVENYLWAVVSLPAGIFQPYSGVKTSILLMDKAKTKQSDLILFLKVENDGFDLGAQRRAIDKNDLTEALQILKSENSDNTELAHMVARSKIAESGDWNLSGERYRVDDDLGISNYEMVELGELCEYIRGVTYSKSDEVDKDGLIELRANNIDVNSGTIKLTELKRIKETVIVSDNRKLKKDDIFICAASGSEKHIGKVAFIENDMDYYFGGFMAVIRVNGKVNPKYLFENLKNDHFKNHIKMSTIGANIRNLKFSIIRDFKIPLPPLSVQEEIVAEIDGYRKIIDGARQVVNNWKPRIKIDPDWEMVELGKTCDINPKKFEVKDLPDATLVSFVPMAILNENNMEFFPVEEKTISEVYTGYTYFKENDVLLARVTPCFENGKAGIAKNLKNGIGFGSSEFFVIRPNDKLLPIFIYVVITADSFRKVGKTKMTGTGGLQRVPKDYLTQFKIPLPDMMTQQKIINLIESEKEVVNANKKLITIYEQKIKDRIAEVWGEETEN